MRLRRIDIFILAAITLFFIFLATWIEYGPRDLIGKTLAQHEAIEMASLQDKKRVCGLGARLLER